MSDNLKNNFGTLVSSCNIAGVEVVTQEEIQSILESDSFVVVPVNVVSILGGVQLVCSETFDNNTNTVAYVSRKDAKASAGAKRLGKHILSGVKAKLKAYVQGVSQNLCDNQIVSAA